MVKWKRVLFITLLFLIWYVWPTEGGQEKDKKEPEIPTISIQVTPRVVLPNPYKRTTFHIIWRIARHPDNRQWSLAYGCDSGESHGSWKSMDGENEAITYDIFREIKAGGGCNFEACVYRKPGKPYRCANQNVLAPKTEK